MKAFRTILAWAFYLFLTNELINLISGGLFRFNTSFETWSAKASVYLAGGVAMYFIFRKKAVDSR